MTTLSALVRRAPAQRVEGRPQSHHPFSFVVSRLAPSLALACLAGWITAACSTPQASGGERQPCYGNGTCDAPFTCASGICVLVSDAGTDTGTLDAASLDAAPSDARELDARELDASTVEDDASSPSDDADLRPDAADAAPGPDGASLDAMTTPDAAIACTPTGPACTSQQIATLDLFATRNSRSVTEEGTIPGTFVSHVDASAGGVSPTDSYLYARFTDTGLERVDVSDTEAFSSTAWDIAFRRFVIRLNSGVSGPSCVASYRMPHTLLGVPPSFDSVTSVPASATFEAEHYMSESTCETLPDGSGLGSPATLLSGYWSYTSCLATTAEVYLLSLANGRIVKLEVIGYYDLADQDACNRSGTLPTTPGSSAQIRVRWAFLR